MKKTVLASALAAIALTASAQSEIARPAGEFSFITKNLTIDGSTYPYSVVGASKMGSSEKEAKFTIYDHNFNTIKTFSIPRKEYKFKTWTEKALAPFTNKVINNKEEEAETEVCWTDNNTGQRKSINTLDDWKQYLKENIGKEAIAFTDEDGNFAYRYQDQKPRGSFEEDNKVEISEIYWYYKKSENTIYRCTLEEEATYSTEGLNWTKIEGEVAQDDIRYSAIQEVDLVDYDANCTNLYQTYLTQSLFNKDEKFELVIFDYKDSGAEGGDLGIQCKDIDNDGILLSRTATDKDYVSYYSIINEDGKELISLPKTTQDVYFRMFKIDGKLYLSTEEMMPNGFRQTVIYSVDDVNTSITELARTTPVAAKKFFNTQGIEVSKDAKGIVIQKDGVKYMNK